MRSSRAELLKGHPGFRALWSLALVICWMGSVHRVRSSRDSLSDWVAGGRRFLLEESSLFRAGWPPPFCAGSYNTVDVDRMSESKLERACDTTSTWWFPLFPFAELEGHLID